ncbi:MAG: hypothetical protein QOK02_4909 [Mycobacterium sp.]|nr:hypothetical protein [Mycobacterium sp.]
MKPRFVYRFRVTKGMRSTRRWPDNEIFCKTVVFAPVTHAPLAAVEAVQQIKAYMPVVWEVHRTTRCNAWARGTEVGRRPQLCICLSGGLSGMLPSLRKSTPATADTLQGVSRCRCYSRFAVGVAFATSAHTPVLPERGPRQCCAPARAVRLFITRIEHVAKRLGVVTSIARARF